MIRARLFLAMTSLLLGCSSGGVESGDAADNGDAGAPSPASASDDDAPFERVEVDFDDIVTDAYEGQYAALFTLHAAKGVVFEIMDSFCPSKPQCLGVHDPDSGRAYAADFDLRFARPVRNLKLRVGGSNDAGIVAKLSAFRDEELLGIVEVPGADDQLLTIPVDLSAMGTVTRVEVRGNTDYRGLTWDDLDFEVRRP